MDFKQRQPERHCHTYRSRHLPDARECLSCVGYTEAISSWREMEVHCMLGVSPLDTLAIADILCLLGFGVYLDGGHLESARNKQ